MTSWSEISLTPSTRQLRQFAVLWLLFFSGMGAWQALVRGSATRAMIFVLLAVTVGPLGCVRPETVRGIYAGWMTLAFPVGWTVSRIVLALLFYGIFTPLGLIFRLAGRDPLRRRRQQVSSYWVEKPAVTDPGRYFKQF